MSLCRDKQIKGFLLFLFLFVLLFVGVGTALAIYRVNNMEVLWLTCDKAAAFSLSEQGASKETTVIALTNTETSEDGQSLLAAVGLGKQAKVGIRPFLNQFQQSIFCITLCVLMFLLLVLSIGMFVLFRKRKRLYQQVDKVLTNHIDEDYSCHLPRNYEGAIFQMFSSVEQPATVLQPKNETEYKAKESLKDTIFNISRQLKTSLAALTMYQEIIENEPENAETIEQSTVKMGISLKCIEQLTLSMLKMARPDTEDIVFKKKNCRVSELIAHSIHELTTRTKKESKEVQIEGNSERQLICDMDWTGKATGNIMRNVLDHAQAGGITRTAWKHTPTMFRVLISDNGSGITPEDTCHIFKRFYRNKHSPNTQGVELGLLLAKSIIDGQGGVTSVQSKVGAGTMFILSFLMEL